MKQKYTNALIHATSSYLLQHAHNPVNWLPWSEKVMETAQRENKLIIVSIGYAACHWCHVMEHESFEDEFTAEIMNRHFICVKVDREERPDIDHYYMTAVQLMQQQGGWPLNVVALPDGRPIWGGTYFPKEVWVKNLLAINSFYEKNRSEAEKYAHNLQEGIRQVSLNPAGEEVSAVQKSLVVQAVQKQKLHFDRENGGQKGAPKFPMPVNLDFLLYYAYLEKDREVVEFVENTLLKMARGGIYDQIGGGFARYSVDEKWKVPHFEKMLYDNAQLMSLYAKAAQHFNSNEFKRIVDEIFEFIQRELCHEGGACYSSLDADSEGEEGRYYVWSSADLKQILTTDYALFARYYNVNGKGFWENGKNILLRDGSDERFAEVHGLDQSVLDQKKKHWKQLLSREREKRVRPGLDDKTLTSWNALLIQALADAYQYIGHEKYLNAARANATFLAENLLLPKGKLWHTWKNGKASVDGFLEDYALCIQAFISMYEVTGTETWVQHAKMLLEYAIKHFYDEAGAWFYFSEKESSAVITNHFQVQDNVIAASNSVMGNNLHRLYLLLGEPAYLDRANKMLRRIAPRFSEYPGAYSNWGTLMLKTAWPFYEIAVSGKNARQLAKEMQGEYRPNTLWAFAQADSWVPLLAGRHVAGETLIYVCSNGACNLPVKSAGEGIAQIS